MLHELQHPQSCRAVHISLHTICQSYTHCETVVCVCVCVSSPIRECCCLCCHQAHLAASCPLPLSFVTFWLFLATCAGPFPLFCPSTTSPTPSGLVTTISQRLQLAEIKVQMYFVNCRRQSWRPLRKCWKIF